MYFSIAEDFMNFIFSEVIALQLETSIYQLIKFESAQNKTNILLIFVNFLKANKYMVRYTMSAYIFLYHTITNMCFITK